MEGDIFTSAEIWENCIQIYFITKYLSLVILSIIICISVKRKECCWTILTTAYMCRLHLLVESRALLTTNTKFSRLLPLQHYFTDL